MGVAEMLEDLMQTEFNTEIADNSQTEIAIVLCKYFTLFSTNHKAELLQAIGQAPVASVTQCESAPGQHDDCSSDEDDIAEMNKMQIENVSTSEFVADDGWTSVVKRSKGKSKKN